MSYTYNKDFIEDQNWIYSKFYKMLGYKYRGDYICTYIICK